LLGSNRGTAPESPSKPPEQAGLRILIAGAPAEPDKITDARIETPAAPGNEETLHEIHLGRITRVLAVGGLVSADVALLGWTTHYVISHQHSLSLWAAAGCTGSVLLAAWCGTAAARLVTLPGK